jgi:hypothetical protein
MASGWDQEASRLQQAPVDALRQRYAEVFGEYPPCTGNKTWLLRRILWRLQALAEGDLSQRAQRQAAAVLFGRHVGSIRSAYCLACPTTVSSKRQTAELNKRLSWLLRF